MNELGYLDVRPILAKVADLDRELVLVGGQAVNFWVSRYQGRVPALARAGPFTSRDIDFCGDLRAVRHCAERLGGKARVATFDDATPNSGTVVFADPRGLRRTLDIVSEPFGLSAREVRETALAVEILDDAGAPTGRRFNVIHPVLSMESRVHNVAGLPGAYDTERGRKQLRASIVCAHEFMRDVLDGRLDAEDPVRTVRKLNERIFRFCTRDPHARELYRATGVDPARALLDHPHLEPAFREIRLPRMREGSCAPREGPMRGPPRRSATRTHAPPRPGRRPRPLMAAPWAPEARGGGRFRSTRGGGDPQTRAEKDLQALACRCAWSAACW